MSQRRGIGTRIVQALRAVGLTRMGLGGLAGMLLLALGAAPAGAAPPPLVGSVRRGLSDPRTG